MTGGRRIPDAAIAAWPHYEPVEHKGPLAEANNIRHAFVSGWLANDDSRIAMAETKAIELLQSLGYTVTPPKHAFPLPGNYDAAISETARDLGIPEDQLRAGRHVVALATGQELKEGDIVAYCPDGKIRKAIAVDETRQAFRLSPGRLEGDTWVTQTPLLTRQQGAD